MVNVISSTELPQRIPGSLNYDSSNFNSGKKAPPPGSAQLTPISED